MGEEGVNSRINFAKSNHERSRSGYLRFFLFIMTSFTFIVVLGWSLKVTKPGVFTGEIWGFDRDPIGSYFLSQRRAGTCILGDSSFLVGKRIDEPYVQGLVKNHNHIVSYSKSISNNTNRTNAAILYVGDGGIIEKVGCM